MSVPHESGHEKTLPAPGSEGFGGKSPMIGWRYAAPSPFEPVARYGDPQKDRRTWPWPFASERLGASQASSLGCIRFNIARSHPSRWACTLAEVEGLEPPRTRFWRPPLSPLSYTSSATPNLQTKKPPRSIPGGLPIWGLSSVVSRHRQAHLAARAGTRHRAAQPILAAVFGERWVMHHGHHGGELLRGSLREVNRNQRKQMVCDAAHSAAAAISPLMRRPSLLALTRTPSPSLMRPARMWPASGFCSSR